MARFLFDLSSLFTPKHNLDQDKRFYQGFVTGLAFDTLRYVNQQASQYADLLQRGQSPRTGWAESLVYSYGDLLEGSEEDELLALLQSGHLPTITKRLAGLDDLYHQYYLAQINDRLRKVTDTFEEAQQRTGLPVIPDVTHFMTSNLQDKNVAALSQQIERIREKTYPQALLGFEGVTFGPTEHHVLTNYGHKQDAVDLWEDVLDELHRKIRRGPHAPHPYQWYVNKALMSTFFQTIVHRRWRDRLRRPGDKPLPDDDLLAHSGDWTDDVDNRAKRQDIEGALERLGSPCAKIIRLHWLEGKTLTEVASQLDYSETYVRTIHRNCLKRLGDLLSGYDD